MFAGVENWVWYTPLSKVQIGPVTSFDPEKVRIATVSCPLKTGTACPIDLARAYISIPAALVGSFGVTKMGGLVMSAALHP